MTLSNAEFTHDNRKTITIIGNGIIGICCALELQKSGFNVAVIDYQDEKKACSYGNAGVLASWSCVPAAMPGVLKSLPKLLLDSQGPISIRPQYLPELFPWGYQFSKMINSAQLEKSSKGMFALHSNSVELHSQLAQEVGADELIKRSNFIYAYEQQEDIDVQAIEWKIRLERDAKVEVIDGHQLREIEPCISPIYQGAVILGPQGHSVNPGRLVKELTAHFIKNGGSILFGKVNKIEPFSIDKVHLHTDQGIHFSNSIVVAAGSWSKQLLKGINLNIPLISERGYHCTFEDPNVYVNNTVMDMKRKFVATSMEMGLRCAGVAEFAQIESSPSKKRLRALQHCSKQLLPEINENQISTWVGSRPTLPDSLPVIDSHPAHPNILMAFGHSHTGLTAAPMTAKLITALALNKQPDINIHAYRADRF